MIASTIATTISTYSAASANFCSDANNLSYRREGRVCTRTSAPAGVFSPLFQSTTGNGAGNVISRSKLPADDGTLPAVKEERSGADSFSITIPLPSRPCRQVRVAVLSSTATADFCEELSFGLYPL